MRIFLAVTDNSIISEYFEAVGDRSLGPVALLVSLTYVYKNIPAVRRLVKSKLVDSVMFDSGTYTLNRNGRFAGGTHHYEKYLDLVRNQGDLADIIASYDIDFGDPYRNQMMLKIMLTDLKNTGLEPKIMPVVHESVSAASEFKQYIDSGAKYITLGSKPSIPADQLKLIRALRYDYKPWLHIFGTLERNYIMRELPESVDTARYAIDPKYGKVNYWSNVTKSLHGIDINKEDEITPEFRAYIGDWFGYTRHDLLVSPAKRCIVCIHGIQLMERYLNDEYYVTHSIVD